MRCSAVVNLNAEDFNYHTLDKSVLDDLFCLRIDKEAKARMKYLLYISLDEIFSLRFQMKLNPPTRRRGGFHPTYVDFIVNTIYPT